MYGKILIYGQLEVVTGMHIGGSDAFSAIGAVDKPVIRDQLSNMPILPGSSLKGKLRTLLARSMSQNVLNMPDFSGDAPVVRRLFGVAYDIVNEAELREDFEALARAMKLLQYDYLGGHGTRGYGRVRFNGLRLMPLETSLEAAQLDELKDILEKGCAELELLRV